MKTRTPVWLTAVAVLVLQSGVQPAWAGRRRRCCDSSPAPASQAPDRSAGTAAQAPAKPPAVASRRRVADAPFQLTAAQQNYVDEVLAAWENKSRRNSSFSASFTCWDYSDANFLPNNLRGQAAQMLDGKIACAAENQRIVKTTAMHKLNPQTGKYERDPLGSPEAWMHDRTSFVHFDGKSKVATEYVLPPGPIVLDSESIWSFANPMVWLEKMFPWQMLHGTEARALKQKYFIRVVTPDEFQKDEIWIDAWPRLKADAKWCRRIIVKLQKDTYEPLAMRIYYPTSFRTYEFRDRAHNLPFALLRDTWMQLPPLYRWEKVEIDLTTK